MASDEKGNKGIKRKSEESAEESANKQLCLGGLSTSSGMTHDDQGQRNVREINWMKNCATNTLRDPQCTICDECHTFYIELSPFKDHYKKEHQDIDTEENESEWIFRYFDFVNNAQHLKCKNCEKTVKVLEFKGPFVKHFNDEAHQEIAEQRSQGINEDAEEVKRRLTIDFLSYLHRTFVLDKNAKEGNNENKKKYERSEEAERRRQGVNEDAEEVKQRDVLGYISVLSLQNPYVNIYTKEGQRDMRKTTWMKCCNINDFETDAQCIICKEYHPFYIDSSTFKDHCKTKHPDIDTEGNESEWIFDHFGIVENTQDLKCKKCKESLEVRNFIGPFVEHFNEAHQVIAERRFQGDNKDTEIAERLRLMKTFIAYLHTSLEQKDNLKDISDARITAWWVRHGKVEGNKVFCNKPNCPDALHPYPVSFFENWAIKKHVQDHYPKVNLEINKNNWNYFSFDDYLLRCKRCKKILSFLLTTDFKAHLKREHIITAPWRGGQSRQGNDNDDVINERTNELMQYLIEEFKF